MFIVIWKYTVAEHSQQAFEQLYGQQGKWVKLFQTAKGYVGTQLLTHVSAKNEYVTIDRWTSQTQYETFLANNKQQFDIIDAEGETYTTSENMIGWFEDEYSVLQ